MSDTPRTRRLLWPRYDHDAFHLVGGFWYYVPHRAAGDTQRQFAQLFGRKPPKRKRKGNRSE